MCVCVCVCVCVRASPTDPDTPPTSPPLPLFSYNPTSSDLRPAAIDSTNKKNEAGLRLCGQKLESLTVASIGDVHNARKEDLGVVKNVTRSYTIKEKRDQKGETPEERGNMTLSVEDPADNTNVLWTKSVRLYLTRLSDTHDLDPEVTPMNLTKIKGAWPVVIDREVVTKWWGPPTVKGSSLQHPSVPFSLALPPSLPPPFMFTF